MAYKPALDDGEVQQINLRAIRDWIKSNKGKIKAKPKSAKVAKTKKPSVLHAKLLRLAKTHPPPQSWFDRTDLAFVPTRK